MVGVALHVYVRIAAMVDTCDLFRRLSRGAKYSKTAVSSMSVFQPRSIPSERPDSRAISSALDFFGDGEDALVDDTTIGVADGCGSLCTRSQKSDQCQKDSDQNHDDNEYEDQIRGKLTFSSDSDEDNKEKSNSEEDGGGHIQLMSGHQCVLAEDREEADQWLTDQKRQRRKRKRSNKQLDVTTSAALKHQEAANAFRNAHRIYVKGADVPDALDSFEAMEKCYKLPPYLLRNIATVGYREPTPVQMQAIPLMLSGRELLACAPTGSGKTAAFIIPILTELKAPKRVGFRAVVMSPTRELAQQTYREFIRLSEGSGFRIHVLTKATASSNNFGPQSSQRFDVLVTTPNRLVHLLSQEPPGVSLHNVEWLVLDEADKLFEDGEHSFKEQVAEIYSACDNPGVKRALFGATLACGVEEFCHIHFDSPVRVTIGVENAATETVQQELLFVGQESGKLLAMRDIIAKGLTPPVLVFVQSVERAKELFHELIYDGMNVDVIHSERTQAQRDNVVRSFRSGKVWVLICTDLMGRGIDFKGVNLVINYDFPPSAISYIHRIGRTGRAGRQGRAITFFTEDDAVNLRSIANVMRSSGCEVPDWMLQLKRPSKNARKKLSKQPVKRTSIKTVTKYDLQKAKRQREMIQSSKRQKQASLC